MRFPREKPAIKEILGLTNNKRIINNIAIAKCVIKSIVALIPSCTTVPTSDNIVFPKSALF